MPWVGKGEKEMGVTWWSCFFEGEMGKKGTQKKKKS